jgi:hypothetical protein
MVLDWHVEMIDEMVGGRFGTVRDEEYTAVVMGEEVVARSILEPPTVPEEEAAIPTVIKNATKKCSMRS